jgi:hypothetical protein
MYLIGQIPSQDGCRYRKRHIFDPTMRNIVVRVTVINRINDFGADTKSYKLHRWRYG